MSNRRMTAYLALTALAVIVLSGVIFGLLYNSEGWRFWRMYGQLEIGMSDKQVQTIFHREPDFQCSFGDFRVLYFFRNAITDRCPNLDRLSKHVDNKNDIPAIYASGELLFSRDNRLIAFTVNGESSHIRTVNGKVTGSSLSRLPVEYFEKGVKKGDKAFGGG